MSYNNRVKRGFTLIELIVFIAIFSIIIVSLIAIFVSLVQVQSNQSAVASVNEESQFLIQQINYYVSSARLIDMTQDVAGSTLVLRELSSQDPTYISPPAISLVEAASFSAPAGGGSSTVTFNTPTTAGELIVVEAYTGPAGNSITAPTDNKGDTYTEAYDVTGIGGAYSYSLWYAANVPAGVVNVSSTPGTGNTNSELSLIAAHYTGIAISNPLDVYNATSTGELSPWASGAVTTGQADELMIGQAFEWSNIGLTPTGNWVAEATSTDYPNNTYMMFTQQIVDSVQMNASNTGTETPDTGYVYPGIATFKILTNPVYLTQGVNGTAQTLTSNKITVSNLSFVRHYNLNSRSSAFGTDSVSYSFTMSSPSTNGSTYSQTFQSSVPVLNPVPKIVLLQQASAEASTTSVSAISSTYYTNNETGDLLLAVVSNSTSSATTSISDTAGNTWSLVASTSYPAYNEKLTVWDALNAKNSSNTVTANFGPGAGYATLNIYEYRGASTSSSFDASSTQLQPDIKTPSSGSANATSAVEMLFGVTYNGNTSEVPSAGTGFTLESSSTASVGNVFIEDSTQYITGPVAATWQYSATTPSSTALIVTFQ